MPFISSNRLSCFADIQIKTAGLTVQKAYVMPDMITSAVGLFYA